MYAATMARHMCPSQLIRELPDNVHSNLGVRPNERSTLITGIAIVLDVPTIVPYGKGISAGADICAPPCGT